MRRSAKRFLKATAVAVAMVLLGGAAPATAAGDDPTPTPRIIGGHGATEDYEWIAALTAEINGQVIFGCGGWLVSRRFVLTAAHCVTNFDGSTIDPTILRVRVGSNDRTTGGVESGVLRILPQPYWDWGTGTDAVSDAALLYLDTYVQKQHIEIPSRVLGPIGTDRAAVRLLGWGDTEPDSSSHELPIYLQELDTKLVQPRHCQDAFIGAGDLCVDNPNGTDGPCYGDSGGPALQKSDRRWKGVGITSRGGPGYCGTTKSVYTDATYFRTWIFDTMRTGTTAPTVTKNIRPDLGLPGSTGPLEVARSDGKYHWALAGLACSARARPAASYVMAWVGWCW